MKKKFKELYRSTSQVITNSVLNRISSKVIPSNTEKPLIMDIGMNNGLDSLFYLRKGFRVVAVEANPLLAEKARQEMSSYIDSGQLIVEELGLEKEEGELTFYMNLDNDQWSSFNKIWGTRNGTRYQELNIKCIKPQQLFQKHGIPYYLKIDIEGADIEVVRALSDFQERPKYISIEENQAYYFAELWAVGCREFKLIDQNNLHNTKCPYPAKEGIYVDMTFNGTTSGPFGEDTPGKWMAFDEILEKYFTEIRSPTRGYLAGASWYDIHGRILDS